MSAPSVDTARPVGDTFLPRARQDQRPRVPSVVVPRPRVPSVVVPRPRVPSVSVPRPRAPSVSVPRPRAASAGGWRAFALRWGLTVLVVVLWAVFLMPQQLGGPVGYVVVSGESMEPNLESGDLVVVRAASDYSVGDVVAFEAAGGLVIHRIIGASPDGTFSVQGDNRSSADLWTPTQEQIVGRAWVTIPAGGRLLGLAQSPLVLAVASATLAFFAVFHSEEGDDEGDDEDDDEDDDGEERVTPSRRPR